VNRREEEIERSPEFRTIIRMDKLGIYSVRWPITRLCLSGQGPGEAAADLFSIGIALGDKSLLVFAALAADNIDMEKLRSVEV